MDAVIRPAVGTERASVLSVTIRHYRFHLMVD